MSVLLINKTFCGHLASGVNCIQSLFFVLFFSLSPPIRFGIIYVYNIVVHKKNVNLVYEFIAAKSNFNGSKRRVTSAPDRNDRVDNKKNQSEYNNTLAHFQMTAFDSCISKNMTFKSRVSRLKMYTFGFECEHSLTE